MRRVIERVVSMIVVIALLRHTITHITIEQREREMQKKRTEAPIYNHPNTRNICLTTYRVWPNN